METLDYLLEYAYLPTYAITVVVAIWRYPRYFDTVFKYFPILLMYTLVTELGGVIVKEMPEFDFVLSDLLEYNNWVIYNIYDIIFYLYFFYVYWLIIRKRSYRNIILVGVVIFLIASVVNIFTSDFTIRLQMITYFTGAAVLFVCIVLYLNYYRSITGKYFAKNNLLSWISLGILVFLLGYVPIIILGHFDYVSFENYQILRRIHLLLILFMYGCFILGFLNMSRKPLN